MEVDSYLQKKQRMLPLLILLDKVKGVIKKWHIIMITTITNSILQILPIRIKRHPKNMSHPKQEKGKIYTVKIVNPI